MKLAIPGTVHRDQAHRLEAFSAKFGSEAEFRERNKMHMSSAKPAAVRCPLCGASFRSQEELAEHKRKSHRM